MTEITGRLLADLHPNGTTRMVFIAHSGRGPMVLRRNGVEIGNSGWTHNT
jgi:hypothetical protein